MTLKIISALVMTLTISGCSNIEYPTKHEQQLEAVDSVMSKVMDNANKANLEALNKIDHSRLAEEVDTVLGASTVQFYTNPEINSKLLRENIEVALDLPYRVLSYSDYGQTFLTYTNSQFIKNRHQLDESEVLQRFESDVRKLVDIDNPLVSISPVKSDIEPGYGITRINSELSFENTLIATKEAILNEDDTVWFNTINFTEEASKLNIKIDNATLYIFGGPGPGGKAMYDYPSMGVDAFGQKLLIVERNGSTYIMFNDLEALAKLHYGKSDLIHKVINFRLNKTLGNSVKK